jgi:exopolysaccharide biosynthesis WecB/TagA/CpsF family protein
MLGGRGFSVATLNLDHVVKLRSDTVFRSAYLAHTHVTADGHPIAWLSRLAGQRVDLLTGADLVVPVAALASDTGTPIALLGSTDDALSEASSALCRRFPDLKIVLRLSPPMDFDPLGPVASDAISALREKGARLCFVALGAPKQEIFAARAANDLPEIGFLSIGAGLDFIAGRQRRAPRLFRALALEWLWRLIGNPKRLLHRYVACVAILPSLASEALRTRNSTGAR